MAVIAKLTQLPAVSRKPSTDAFAATDDASKATFEVVEFLKGEKVLGKTRTIQTVYFGPAEVGRYTSFAGADGHRWPAAGTGRPSLARATAHRDYIKKVVALPKEGVERIAFFQDYLEDSEDLLARDAYDEFAKVPFSGVKDLKDRLRHDQILAWAKDQQIPVSRRRLYLTMLGVCGNQRGHSRSGRDDSLSDNRQDKSRARRAFVAAYLTLKGPDGMKLVEDLFLKNEQAEYTETYAVIMALRFHGQEEKVIPRERLLEGLRIILDRPQLADLVIPDLARWQDWSVMDRLVKLFKNADDESSWVRVPVINYLQACPLPQAKKYIEELAT